MVGIGGEEMLLNDLATLRVEVRPVTRAIMLTKLVRAEDSIATPNRLHPLFTWMNLPLPRSISAILPFTKITIIAVGVLLVELSKYSYKTLMPSLGLLRVSGMALSATRVAMAVFDTGQPYRHLYAGATYPILCLR